MSAQVANASDSRATEHVVVDIPSQVSTSAPIPAVSRLPRQQSYFSQAADAFTSILFAKVEAARKRLSQIVADAHARAQQSGQAVAPLYVPIHINPFEQLHLSCSDGSIRNYFFHVLMYGPLRTGGTGEWTDRDVDCWMRNRILPPFRRVQTADVFCFLVDVSDPTKGKPTAMFVRLYNALPPRFPALWHGFQNVPNVGRKMAVIAAETVRYQNAFLQQQVIQLQQQLQERNTQCVYATENASLTQVDPCPPQDDEDGEYYEDEQNEQDEKNDHSL